MPERGGSFDAPPEVLLACAVEDGIRRYMAECRQRVPDFVARHFSLAGSLRIHQEALGLDLLRAPANLLLMGPHAAMKLTGLAAAALGKRKLARRIEARSLILRTDVSRRIEQLLRSELLELPFRDSPRDALAEAILEGPRLTALAGVRLRIVGQQAGDPEFRARLLTAMTTYGTTRAAAAEITTSLLILAAGALVLKEFTPGAVTLGPALAALIAHRSAVAAFPLGARAGAFWYAMFPVTTPVVLTAGLTAGMMLAASLTAAFAGLIMDPIQRHLGLHTRRLMRLLNAIERQLLDPEAPAFVVHDHYVARLIDLFDLLGSAWRLAHP